MTNPLIKYEEGQFWKSFGGVYYPSGRFNAVMTREMFLTRTGPDAERYAKEAQDALNDYEREKQCAAAKA